MSKKKVLLLTGIGLILLVAVIAVALNAVFTVTDVKMNFARLSEEGAADAVKLQLDLEKAYVGKSTTFAKTETAEEIVKNYPSLALEEVHKEFPRTVVLTVSERKEAFSFRRSDNGRYAVLDEEGRYLYDRDTNTNRRKGENILFDGFVFEDTQPGELVKGELFDRALAFVQVFLDNLGDARANIVSVTLVEEYNPILGNNYLSVRMREGVIIKVYFGEKEDESRTMEKKANAALAKYLSLSDAEKLYGYFDVIDSAQAGPDGNGFTVGNHRV